MSAAVNSMIGAQSDSIGEGTGGSESGEEFGTSESRASWGTRLVFGSIAVVVAAPEAVSSESILGLRSRLRVEDRSGFECGLQGTVRLQS